MCHYLSSIQTAWQRNDHKTLALYYNTMAVKGNAATLFFEFKAEIKLFFENGEERRLYLLFTDKAWLQGLVYLTDITKKLINFELETLSA